MKGKGVNQQDHRCINMSSSRSNVQLISFLLSSHFEKILVSCKYAKDIRNDGVSFCHFCILLVMIYICTLVHILYTSKHPNTGLQFSLLLPKQTLDKEPRSIH